MDSNMILMSVQDKLPKDFLEQQQLKEKLDSLDEKSRDELMAKIPMLGLKSPAFVFWIANFCFGWLGVARFMIGDMVLGGVRLALVVIFFVFSVIVAGDSNSVLARLGSLCLFIIMVWNIVDLFLVGKKLRKQNLNKLLSILPQ